MVHRLLVINTGNRFPDDFPQAAERSGPARIDMTPLVSTALDMIQGTDYDAVVCGVDSIDELAVVIRVRKARPEVPVLVVTAGLAPELGELMLRTGATAIVQRTPVVEDLIGPLQRAVERTKFAKAPGSEGARTRVSSDQIRQLADECRRQADDALQQLRSSRAARFVPLLVEDDPDQGVLMKRACATADVGSPLTVVNSVDSAIAFLDGHDPLADPPDPFTPTLALIDLHLGDKSGFEVLRWIRKDPRYRALTTVILTSSTDPRHIEYAYALGADSYLVKPAGYPSLVEMMKSVRDYWSMRMNCAS